MNAKVMLLLLGLAMRHTEVFEQYGNKMDKTQIKFTVDIFLGSILDDFIKLGSQLRLATTDAEKEKLQLEMAVLVEYYDELGLIPAIKKHWPVGSPLFDMLIKLRQDKDKIKT
jgi:hypothetical protein